MESGIGSPCLDCRFADHIRFLNAFKIQSRIFVISHRDEMFYVFIIFCMEVIGRYISIT